MRSSEDALVNNQRRRELQDARIAQADADIAAAQAGIEAAKSAIANAHAAIDATKADVERTEFGAAPAGSAISGRVCEAAKGGASSSR